MKFRSILNQIADDKIEDVFETFEFFFNNLSELKKTLLLIQANYNSLKSQERLDVIEQSDFFLEKNKIRKSILDVFAQIESLIEEKPQGSHNLQSGLTNKSQTALKIVQNAVIDKGYEIVSQIYSDQSSYYFKAKRNSFIQKDYYVIQVLNWYKLNNSPSGYNQIYLDFFSRSPHPFVDLIEFHPGNPSYIIRKYAKGIDLTNLIQSGIKLSLLKALDVIISISKGLKALHDAQIFYNNLIPDQIILDNNLNLYLLPLNIFEENANVVTWKNLKDGIKFMSPEQLTLAGDKAAQNKLTVVSNQFSLGLILVYILMGEPLFDGQGLPSLYEDRVNQEDTKGQLRDFYHAFHKKLLQYGISEKISQELLDEFIDIFKKLIQNNPADRHQRFEDFISKVEFLKLRIEREKKPFEEQALYHVSNSFYRSIRLNDNLIEELYQVLITQLPSKKSMEETSKREANKRNIRLQYALNYLFTSISNLNNQEYLAESLACLVKNHHFDFTIEDYKIFFKFLKESIVANDSDWNNKIDEAWDYFIEHSLDAVDAILSPAENAVPK